MTPLGLYSGVPLIERFDVDELLLAVRADGDGVVFTARNQLNVVTKVPLPVSKHTFLSNRFQSENCQLRNKNTKNLATITAADIPQITRPTITDNSYLYPTDAISASSSSCAKGFGSSKSYLSSFYSNTHALID